MEMYEESKVKYLELSEGRNLSEWILSKETIQRLIQSRLNSQRNVSFLVSIIDHMGEKQQSKPIYCLMVSEFLH